MSGHSVVQLVIFSRMVKWDLVVTEVTAAWGRGSFDSGPVHPSLSPIVLDYRVTAEQNDSEQRTQMQNGGRVARFFSCT
jgi:hypothetical protein